MKFNMIFCSYKSIIAKSLFVFIFSYNINVYSQTCPVWDKRNNGNDPEDCGSTTGLPSGYSKTGTFEFTNASYASGLTRAKVWKNGILYQDGNTLVTSGTVWFGHYFVASNNKRKICFYADGGNGVPPAANWRFQLTTSDGSTTIECTYAITSSGSITSFSAGSIGSNQTICSGSTPSTISSTADASSCSSGTISYQWQSSTTSSTNGFSDIGSATSASYSPGSLTQTTYFQRVATCSGDASVVISNVVTITISQIAGTISPMPGTTWSGATTTFSTSGTSGGTWSLNASPAGIASINSSTGVLTASSAGSGTVTYTVTSGGLTCSSTRNFTISGTSGSLPVTWETVSAQKQNGQSILRWSTASEQNTRDFVVQHSLNATDWSSLSTIPAAGNSTTTRNYSYVHQNPLKGNNYNYYRILQRDIDDKFSYSKIVSIIFNETGSDVQVYPNPVHDQLTVFLAESQWVRLVNAAGATVWKGQLPAGRNTIPVQGYSKGAYVLTAGTQSFRVLIQ